MEDILTSNVFGLLKYVPPEEGLLNYLALSEDKDGNQPLKYLRSLNEVSQNSISYEFWPWWEEPNCYGCEPDVYQLEIPDKQDLLVLIEENICPVNPRKQMNHMMLLSTNLPGSGIILA